MAINSEFSTLLKKVQVPKIIFSDLAKNMFMFNAMPKDQTWHGGEYEFAKRTAIANTIRRNVLAAKGSINKIEAVKPAESSLVKFFHSSEYDMLDLDLNNRYSDGSKAASYIKLIKDQVKDTSEHFKNVLSRDILAGGMIDKATVSGTSGGVLGVTFYERFHKNMHIVVRESDGPNAVEGYVRAVDPSAKTVTIYDAVSGGSAVDLSAYTVAKGTEVYHIDTVNTSTGALVSGSSMNDFRSSLLSSANGGNATIHGITKASYPEFQAHNFDMSGATAENLLEKLYEAMLEIKRVGRGNPADILLSYTNFGYAVKNLELSDRFKAMDDKKLYGFDGISILGPTGQRIRLVPEPEMDNDVILFWDRSSVELAGTKFFENETMNKMGQPFYVDRATTGYVYIQDIKFYGNLIWQRIEKSGIGYGLSI